MNYEEWVGRERADWDILTSRLAESYDAMFEKTTRSRPVGEVTPHGIHWLLCQPRAAQTSLGPDGHPTRGDFLPPVELPRRMWAGSKVEFAAPLRVGDEVRLLSRIASVSSKQGSTGPLVFVEVDHSMSVDAQVRILERQTIVYREPPAERGTTNRKTKGKTGAMLSATQSWSRRSIITPDSTLLFRFSALTFNGHRIHYDQDYARGVEGYPTLVVHAPLTATLMLRLFAADIGPAPITFSFRGVSPLFMDRPLEVRGRKDGELYFLEARDNEDHLSMTGSIAPLHA